MLGEDIAQSPAVYEYQLPDIASTTVYLLTRATAQTKTSQTNPLNSTSNIDAKFVVNGETVSVPYSLSASKIFSSDNGQYYRTTTCSHAVTLPELLPEGEVQVSLVSSVHISNARLDYNVITYERNNTLPAGASQVPMCFPNLSAADALALSNVPSSIQVWNVDNANAPVNCKLQTAGSLTLAKPGMTASVGNFVAFDPTRELLSITGFEEVPNQDLHGASTPDLLIVSIKEFLPQANRVADLHRQHDGMDVVVVDQEQVFNEFSSGTPDAMAIRLMCKMFYDRDPNKFKNLLMFGTGCYDNRGISFKKDYSLITFESNDSYSEEMSYVSDDFFGLLDDNSGNVLERDYLRIGVGRFTSTTPTEAQTDVDKLVSYVTSPDYGVWRNNVLLVADEGDKGLHVFQTEGICNKLETFFSPAMHPNKAYVEMFPRATNEAAIAEANRSCPEGKRHIIESLKGGQYFMTYVGHAGFSVMTKNARMWRIADVEANEYAHYPITTTACCNVARYDSNTLGISEVMFHKPNGGAIALLTSARDVEANNNDMLNQAFVNAMFTVDDNGKMPTLGEAYMKAKQSFGRVANTNKMSFFLMGDPAIKVNFPQPNFIINTINGESVESSDPISIAPMQRLVIEAQVMTPDGSSIDTSFDGDATVTLYDVKRYHATYVHKPTGSTWTESRDIYHERPMLGQVQGRVSGGHFVGELVVPRFVTAQDELVQLQVYAHRDNSEQMVNGVTDNLLMTSYDEQTAIVDEEAPVIEKMFLNDEMLFEQNTTVQTSATLFVKVTDNEGLGIQTATASRGMQLLLDGNKESYYTVKNHATCTDDGRTLNVSFPLSKLAPGMHTLTFTVCDLAGNAASRTISFVVGQQGEITLDVADKPAIKKATIEMATNTSSATPVMTLRVVNPQGELVWKGDNCTLPYDWNLCDKNGNRVKAGLYKVFGTYSSGNAYGGTPLSDIVVLPER